MYNFCKPFLRLYAVHLLLLDKWPETQHRKKKVKSLKNFKLLFINSLWMIFFSVWDLSYYNFTKVKCVFYCLSSGKCSFCSCGYGTRSSGGGEMGCESAAVKKHTSSSRQMWNTQYFKSRLNLFIWQRVWG